MAIVSNSVDIRGVAAEPIIEEILFQNNTINKGLVTFEDDIKAETIFTEVSAEAQMQAYTSGVPTSQGSLDTWDTVITPKKVLFYQEFDPETIRFSRYKRSMAPGAWNNFSTEFERVVIGGQYAPQVSLSAERNFWLGATTASANAIAALTPGATNADISTEEQAMAAASLGADAQFDGILTKFLYNDSRASGVAGLGERNRVVGTTIDASNIKAEYDKVFLEIPSVVLQGMEKPIFYAPYSHKQLIATFNNNVANYKDAFLVSGDSYTFNGLQIVFVPIPENVIISALKSHLFWCTDLTSDVSRLKLEKIAANREDMFLKSIMTETSHVANQKFNVLYVG